MTQVQTKTAVILDAAPAQRDRVRSALMEQGFSVLCFSRDTSLLDNFHSLSPRLLLIGQIDEQRMMRIFYTIKANNASFPILFARCSETVYQLMESNGFANVACLNGDLSPEKLRMNLENLNTFDKGPKPEHKPPVVVGRSLEMQKIRKLIREIGPSMAPVLITGEPGTGKDLMVQAIHHDGKLPDEKLVKIDIPACLAAPNHQHQDWLPQKLGSLMAASENARGKDQPARRRTIMIDGIDHLPLDQQERFANFLAGNSHNGDTVEDPGRTLRLICTSRDNIARLVDAGRFREDLYHMLSVFAIAVPPLRMRPDDIPLLADYFEGVYCLALSRTVMDISGDAKDLMLAYEWPGNVSELKQLIFDALSTTEEGFLSRYLQNALKEKGHIHAKKPATDFEAPCLPSAEQKNETFSLKDACKTIVEKTEKKIIAQALDKTNWNRRRAARILDVSYRTLLNKIKTYGLK